MSKGYADYLVALAREFNRDLQRDIDGVEVPLFSGEYEEWLEADKKVSKASQVNYHKWLAKADSWICESNRDFWTLLKKAWDASDFETARKLCQEYENRLLEEKAYAEREGKDEAGESAKNIANWVAAFRKYRRFFEEMIHHAETDKKVRSQMIERSRQSSKELFLSSPFASWCEAMLLSEDTVDSYVSDIKRVNREIFCKTGYDLLSEYLPEYVKAKNIAKIDEMFSAMDGKLTERIENLDETEMPVASLMNGRTALRNYADFIRSILFYPSLRLLTHQERMAYCTYRSNNRKDYKIGKYLWWKSLDRKIKLFLQFDKDYNDFNYPDDYTHLTAPYTSYNVEVDEYNGEIDPSYTTLTVEDREEICGVIGEEEENGNIDYYNASQKKGVAQQLQAIRERIILREISHIVDDFNLQGINGYLDICLGVPEGVGRYIPLYREILISEFEKKYPNIILRLCLFEGWDGEWDYQGFMAVYWFILFELNTSRRNDSFTE